jgi:hypothetical protein
MNDSGKHTANETIELQQKLEFIRGLEISLRDRISILLVLKGIKPACMVDGEVDAGPLGLFSETREVKTHILPSTAQVEYLKSLGIDMPEPVIEDRGTPVTNVAKGKDVLDELTRLEEQLRGMGGVHNAETYDIHYKIGKLLGYPESCLGKLGTKYAADENEIEIPDHLQNLSKFIFTKENWQEELKTVEKWYEEIKDLIPQINF